MLQSSLPVAIDAFVPPLSPLALLAFLGGGFLIFASGLGAAIALAGRRSGLAKVLGAGSLALLLAYGAALVGAALLSRDRTLRQGEKKYFCEMDCHVAYSLAEASSPAETVRAVTVLTWFDPSTIASFRGNAPLTPNPRVVYLVDAAGKRYFPSASATRAWEQHHPGSTPLDRPLRPGEEHTTTFVFEVPAGIQGTRLFLGDPPSVETLLIGHENSPWHGKVYFALPDGPRNQAGPRQPAPRADRLVVANG
jgi:hypothetical protein